jgi:hypothetical protein
MKMSTKVLHARDRETGWQNLAVMVAWYRHRGPLCFERTLAHVSTGHPTEWSQHDQMSANCGANREHAGDLRYVPPPNMAEASGMCVA